MVINHRRLRSSLGSRATRKQGTKLNTSVVKERHKERPKTRMKNLIRDIRAGKVEHP